MRFGDDDGEVAEADAEDLANDTFLRALKAQGDYRGEAEWSYLERIAHNVGLNRVRSFQTMRRGVQPVELDEGQELVAAEVDLDAAIDDERRRRLMRDAIAALPPRQRQVIQLWLEDFSREEMARVRRDARADGKGERRSIKRNGALRAANFPRSAALLSARRRPRNYSRTHAAN